MRPQVKEGERILDNWYVASTCPANTEWVVAHYVGGEEYEIVDDYFYSKKDAMIRAHILNAEGRVHEYFRDWEGDPEYEYENWD